MSGDMSCPFFCCKDTLTSKSRGSKRAHPRGHGPGCLGDVLVQQGIIIFCLAECRAKCPDAQGHNHLSFCAFKLTSHRHSPAAFPRPSSQSRRKAEAEPSPSPSGNPCSFTGDSVGRLSTGCGGAGPLAVPGRRLVVFVALLRVLFQPSSGLPQAQVVLELFYSFSVGVVLFASGRTLTSK